MKIAALLVLWPGMLAADAWAPLDGAGIAAMLTDRQIVYENATQHFYASGRTLYNTGQDSWGNWVVRGDQYCSQWPPGDMWDCYHVAAAIDRVRFIAADGSTTDGELVE